MKSTISVALLFIYFFVSCSNPEDSAIEPNLEEDMVEVSFNLTGPDWESVRERPIMRSEGDSTWVYHYMVYAMFDARVLYVYGFTKDIENLTIKVNKNFNYEVELSALKLLEKDFDAPLFHPYDFSRWWWDADTISNYEINSLVEIDEFEEYSSNYPYQFLRSSSELFLPYYDEERNEPFAHPFPSLDYFRGAMAFNIDQVTQMSIEMNRGTFGLELEIENLNQGNIEALITRSIQDSWPFEERDSTIWRTGQAGLYWQFDANRNFNSKLFSHYYSIWVSDPRYQFFNSEMSLYLMLRYHTEEGSEIILNRQITIKRNTIRTYLLDLEDFLDDDQVSSSFRLDFIDSDWNREDPKRLTPEG